jgi:MFS family permease
MKKGDRLLFWRRGTWAEQTASEEKKVACPLFVVRLVIVAFLESLATILVEGAVYFFAHERLGFSNAMNLSLALAFGAVYVIGATWSGPLSHRLGERRTLLAAAAAQVTVFGALALFPVTVVLFAGNMAMGLLFGLKWPVIESYFSAGYAPRETAKAIGRFNISWTAALPIALALAGPLIAWRDWALFAAGGAIALVNLLLIAPLPPRPEHLPADHPARPAPEQIRRLGHLLTAARWLMLAAYSSMWILRTLLPGIFSGLGVQVSAATALSGLLDVARLVTFIVLGYWTAWHGRRLGLVRSMALLSAGFLMVLFAPNLPTVLLGEAIFGVAAGEIYYASLYYGMVAQNASVSAGGGHERMIGLGFAIGPAAGLLGVAMRPLLGEELLGVLAVAGLLLAVCFLQAARSLLRIGGR